MTRPWTGCAVMLNAETITESFCLRRWPAFWHESQMPDWVGLTFVKFPTVRSKSPGYARWNERFWKWLVHYQKGFSVLPGVAFRECACFVARPKKVADFEYLQSRIFSLLASTSIEHTLHCINSLPTVQQTFSHCNFNHFLTSLRSTFREALKINTLLSREIPILLLTFYRKRHPLAGGTSSIVHYREYPSDQWDFFVKTQLTIHLKREC